MPLITKPTFFRGEDPDRKRCLEETSLDALYKSAAPCAILNTGGWADIVRCHPGTREEVIGHLTKWTDDSNVILWLTGPAGAGKSAITQTIAERSTDRRSATVNSFFFRGDSTRNSAHPLISTLLHQLFQLYPSSLAVAEETISKGPRILDESLDEQCKLISALFSIIRQSAPAGPPIDLLIDGLDECDVKHEKSQLDILRALERLVTQPDSPSRLLAASRRESRSQMTFDELPSHAPSIFLSEEYSPENDIRIFLEAEFTRIQASDPSSGSLPGDWPSCSDVETTIANAILDARTAPPSMSYLTPASPAALSQFDSKCSMPTVDKSDRPLGAGSTDATHLAPKEHTMTIHPLLLPPPGQPSVSADQLANLYFRAVIGPQHIPEFKAEYTFVDGQRDSILLTVKDVHHADYLKEMWDSVDRENSYAPGLADISLYRGNTTDKYSDTAVQETAFDELAFYKLAS